MNAINFDLLRAIKAEVESIRFNPEIRVVIITGAGGTQRLPRLIGRGKAKELIFTGRRVDAMEALDIGLVKRICEPNLLMDEAMNMARMICEAGPIAIDRVREILPLAPLQKIHLHRYEERPSICPLDRLYDILPIT